MARYKAIVSYVGKNYVGWQTQANGVSIQQVIENCLSEICNENIKITASGRTDAGVNAEGQTFHFDCSRVMDGYRFRWAINGHLPNDIHVLKIEMVSSLFHARYSVLSKTYVYKINLGEYNVFSRDYVYNCDSKLDVNRMIDATKIFVGYHDFTSFCSNNTDKFPNQKREIFSIDFAVENDILSISFKGRGFLRYMVRMLAAALMEVGKGKLTKSDLQRILQAKTKDALNKNAHPCGLTLKKVDYFRIVYLDDEIMIRSIHKEDKRILGEKDFSFEQLYGVFKRNEETLLGLFRYCDDILVKIEGEFNLNNTMENKTVNQIKSNLF